MFKFFEVHFLKTAFFNPPLGDSHCFLFSVKPTMGVYQPTGYNENYMYLNMGMQTMPNGLVSSNEFGTILLTVPPPPPPPFPPLLGIFVKVWVEKCVFAPFVISKMQVLLGTFGTILGSCSRNESNHRFCIPIIMRTPFLAFLFPLPIPALLYEIKSGSRKA